MSKWAWRVLLVFVIWYVATQPGQAATLGHHILGMAQHVGSSVATFLNGL